MNNEGAEPSTPSGAISDPWVGFRDLTPARVALGRAGVSVPTTAQLELRLAHARAREAVGKDLDVPAMETKLQMAGLPIIVVGSEAADRETYIHRPDLGRRLSEESADSLAAASPARCDVIFLVADGLSAQATERHATPLIAHVLPLLSAAGWRIGPLVIARQARVALADEVGELLGARIAVILIGERPGMSSSDSLGVYVTWGPRRGRSDAERNCISNVRPGGLSYETAGQELVDLLDETRREGRSGVALAVARERLRRTVGPGR